MDNEKNTGNGNAVDNEKNTGNGNAVGDEKNTGNGNNNARNGNNEWNMYNRPEGA